MADYHYSTALALTEAIRQREIRSTELLEIFVDRAQRLNPALNAIVTYDIERARKRANKLDELTARNQFVGPLHGLPITVKDTFETAGIRTTAGSNKLSHHIPSDNAIAVQRLLDAGAVIFGKTNTPAFAADLQTNNSVFGVTNNPWDVSRTPGGSSGGSAVAVAMGFSAFDIGSDIGGSLRTPAHFCGIYTIKPSYGIIPTAGLLSTTQRNLYPRDISCIGPLTRSAKDLSLVLDVLAGPNDMEAVGWQLQLPKAPKALKDYRVAAWLDDDFCPVDNAIVEQLQLTVAALQQHGVTVDCKARPKFSLREANDFYIQLLAATSVGDIPDHAMEKRRLGLYNYSEHEQQKLAYKAVESSLASVHQFAKAKEAQQRLRWQWQQFFQDFDVLLCPVNFSLAFPHIDTDSNFFQSLRVNKQVRDYAEMWVWIGALAGVAYLPAVSAPIGLSKDGLPVGIQIIAPYLHDHRAIDFADQLAGIHGGFQPPPLAQM
jgi:amidase